MPRTAAVEPRGMADELLHLRQPRNCDGGAAVRDELERSDWVLQAERVQGGWRGGEVRPEFEPFEGAQGERVQAGGDEQGADEVAGAEGAVKVEVVKVRTAADDAVEELGGGGGGDEEGEGVDEVCDVRGAAEVCVESARVGGVHGEGGVHGWESVRAEEAAGVCEGGGRWERAGLKRGVFDAGTERGDAGVGTGGGGLYREVDDFREEFGWEGEERHWW